MRHFCTLFDVNYLMRGLALYDSLRATCSEFKLTVLCLDYATFRVLSELRLDRTELVSVEQLEAWDPDLAAARPSRTKVEYYFTCKPALMSYIVETARDVDRITYLDSDLYFFADPGVLDREIGGCAVALTPHRFPKRLAERIQYGVFNAGWVSASAAADGLEFIGWWRQKCYEWCRAIVEETRFADQKYLDETPRLFRSVHIVQHRGANLAPWNLENYVLGVKEGGETLTVDGEAVVFFHFHGLKPVLWRLYDSGLLAYGQSLSTIARDLLYRPYLRTVTRWDAAVRATRGKADETTMKDAGPGAFASSLVPRAAPSLKDRLRLTYRLLQTNSAVIAP